MQKHYCWNCKMETDHRADTTPDFLICAVCGKANWADDYPISPIERPANPLIAARQRYQNERNAWMAAHFSEWVMAQKTEENAPLVQRILLMIKQGRSGYEITGDLELMQDGYFDERKYWQARDNEGMVALYQAKWDLASSAQAHIAHYWMYEKVS